LHDALLLEQLARQPSVEALAKRRLMLLALPVSAAAVSAIVIKSNPLKIHFIKGLHA
jgi:hypothetical protein